MKKVLVVIGSGRSMMISIPIVVVSSMIAIACAGGGTGNAVPAANLSAANTNREISKISKEGSRTVSKGPEKNFTGTVVVEMLFTPAEPARVSGAKVTFEPGARTAWHFHPLGQTLIVTSGTGWVQSEGGSKREIRAGDVVSCPPNEKHWHGATESTAMTHIAIQEALDGKPVEWLQKVTDEEYMAKGE